MRVRISYHWTLCAMLLLYKGAQAHTWAPCFFLVSLHCVSSCICISLWFASFACHPCVCYYFRLHCYFHSGCYYFLSLLLLFPFGLLLLLLLPFAFMPLLLFFLFRLFLLPFTLLIVLIFALLLLPFTLLVLTHFVLLYVAGVPSFALLLLLLMCLLIMLLKLVLPFPLHFASWSLEFGAFLSDKYQDLFYEISFFFFFLVFFSLFPLFVLILYIYIYIVFCYDFFFMFSLIFLIINISA